MPDEKPAEEPTASRTAQATKGGNKKRGRPKGGGKKKASAREAGRNGRTRAMRPYPAVPFEEALPLAHSMQELAGEEKVRRLTLLTKLNKSPASSGTRMLITNATRYGLITGNYNAEWLALTDLGKLVTNPAPRARDKREAEFKLAIEDIEPFKFLYDQYKGKRVPSHEVMRDLLQESTLTIPNPQECIDTFIVNAKYLGLLSTIAGAETLLPIDHVLDTPSALARSAPAVTAPRAPSTVPLSASVASGKTTWSKICFYIAPIGDEASELRKHSDMFLGSLLEPALKDFDLEVVRADKIGEPGMIPSQVIEHIMRAALVVVDMSYHNPNVFYEMALHHACRLPIVQITRKADKLPFDVNQMRTVVVDTSDIYALVPRIETYRSEIASHVRSALAEGEAVMTPLSVFFPGFAVTIPKEN